MEAADGGAATDRGRSPADGKPEAGSPPGSRSILIVEDNADSRYMLGELLRLDGYDISVADDGPSGLRAIESECPDVALIDIGLPGMNGYELAENVRTKLGNQRVLLVALTGHGRAEDRRAVREAGFDEHLVKPLNLDDLGRILREPR